jgi:hypothetical protein
VRDLVFLGLAAVGLLVGALIAWRLLRRPAAGAAPAGPAAPGATPGGVVLPKGTR